MVFNVEDARSKVTAAQLYYGLQQEHGTNDKHLVKLCGAGYSAQHILATNCRQQTTHR